jgi:hypothetical protein
LLTVVFLLLIFCKIAFDKIIGRHFNLETFLKFRSSDQREGV